MLLPMVAPCQSNQDYHLTQDPDRAIYQSSAFAHGHRHGYEEGFHAGDEDYQMRREPSAEHKLPKDRGYQASFGSKRSYLAGFEHGFRAGYADSYTGHTFRRSLLALSDLSAPQSSADSRDISAYQFDLGLADGYRQGLSNSDNIADQPGIAESAAWRCRQDAHPAKYCSGFGAGYVIGRWDSRSIAWLPARHTDLAKNSSH
jgi:hypothetical protein